MPSIEWSKRNILKQIKHQMDLDVPDHLGITPLMHCVRSNNTPLAKRLLSSGSDIDHYDSNGWTALTQASSMGHTEMIQLLISSGADIDKPSLLHTKQTALMYAARSGCLDIVEILIKNGANIEVQDRKGDTALSKAFDFASTWKDDRILNLLLDQGADVNTLFKANTLSHVLTSPQLKKFLLNHECIKQWKNSRLEGLLA